MSQADYAIARRIYSLSSSFYFYMFYMTLAAVEAVLAFLFGGTFLVPYIAGLFNNYLPGIIHISGSPSSPLQLIISVVNEALSLSVLALSPAVLFSVTKTWASLSKWRRAFLRFAILSNIESVALESPDSRENLLRAVLAANPDYERILNRAEKSLRSEGEPGPILTIPSDLFKNVTVSYRRKVANFDVLIGLPPRSLKKSSSAANLLLRNKTSASALRSLSTIGITAGRIVQGKPSVDSYLQFEDDLKLLSSFADTAVMRGFLVFSETPPLSLITYANDRRNWPKHEFTRIPIVLLSQEENGFAVSALAS